MTKVPINNRYIAKRIADVSTVGNGDVFGVSLYVFYLYT